MVDALVIGAGPSGSTAARLLAAEGWSVALVEKAAFPRRKLCGEFVSATNAAVFSPDLYTLIAKEAGPEIRRVGVFSGPNRLMADMPAPTEGARWGRALDREILDAALRDAAVTAGAALWQPWSVTGLEREGDLHRCHLESREGRTQFDARIVIAAHGSWSPTPPTGRVHYPHRPGDLFAFKAHFAGGALPPDLMSLLVFPGGYGGLVHTNRGRISLSCCIRRDELKRRRGEAPGESAGEAVFRHILANCEGVRDALSGAAREGSWLSAGPIRTGVRRFEQSGIFFVGNAAAEAHPIIAEGISMAIQSSWLLCRELSALRGFDAKALEAAGRRYAAGWKTHLGTRTAAAAGFAAIAVRPRAVALLTPLVKNFPAMVRVGARLSGKSRAPRLYHPPAVEQLEKRC
jgi:2-polyprenyl-6-methoxyphenol hydroxylase-like FAD-dependent oxidoreductase